MELKNIFLNRSRKFIGKIIILFINLIKQNIYATKIYAFILNNPLYKGALILGSGTAIAQLIGILSMPIITRLYSPSDIGILAAYSSILAIVGMSASFRYELAFSLPEEKGEAINLFALCIVLLFVTTITFGVIIYLGGGIVVYFLNLGTIEEFLWLLILGFFGTGTYTILNYWGIRQRDYNAITYTKINQGIGSALIKITLGIFSWKPIGLILGHMFSQFAGVNTLGFAMWKKERDNLKEITWKRIIHVARKYYSFPLFNFPASIINTMSLQLPTLILLATFDSQVVGFYALAHSMMILPSSVISRSMGQAYLGEASKMMREKSQGLRMLYMRTIKHLSIVAIVIIGIPALCAPFLVPIIFGRGWSEAGLYCLPLAIMVIMGFVASPTSMLTMYGFNHWTLLWDITRFCGVFLGFYICKINSFSVIFTLVVYAIFMLIMYLVSIYLNMKAIKIITSKISEFPTPNPM